MRVRRSRHLITYWRDGALLACNYATRNTLRVTPFICQILDLCDEWTSLVRIRTALAIGADSALPGLIAQLVESNLLEQSGRAVDPRVRAMSRLDSWNPEAGFFHTSTRDVRFDSPARVARFTRLQSQRAPRPPVVKRYRGVNVIDLQKTHLEGDFPRTLTSRRTWRRFSATPITREELSTLLGLTVGAQQWVEGGDGPAALKTSPSGGARHPIEAYIVVRDVRNLPPGIYHYAPDRHALEQLSGPVSIERMRAYLPNSGYFTKGSAIVFFTAIFERILWRYRYSRAYRAALVEAGHVCQTFCLTATWLGLAPYCLMGLADSAIEEDLGLDGIGESVLYAAGVGRRPRGADWAPLTRGTLRARKNPRL
jgi:SagB-type dehydrogenase family enzyme